MNRLLNRYNFAMAGALAFAGVVLAVMFSVPTDKSDDVLRAVVLGLSSGLIMIYLPAANPIPFFQGKAAAEHVAAGGVIGIAVSMIALLSRPTFFSTCTDKMPCFGYFMAVSVFFFIFGAAALIVGPPVLKKQEGWSRVRFWASVVVGTVVLAAALIASWN